MAYKLDCKVCNFDNTHDTYYWDGSPEDPGKKKYTCNCCGKMNPAFWITLNIVNEYFSDSKPVCKRK